jgi:metallophosphoesterase (TIGR00282 family)
MKVLFIGDIVGQPGRDILARRLNEIIDETQPDFVVANGENAAGGKGLTGTIAKELFDLGIQVLTLGNHAFDRREIEEALIDPRILRPANYPPNVPGKGWGVYAVSGGRKLAVVNLLGRVYLPAIDDPFRTANDILEKIYAETRNILVDIHAEVTSEKVAMGWYLDGRVSAVVGTHTHIPTADERIMPKGTAYLTDAGMTGPTDGVIGMDRDVVIKKFLTGIPQHFVVAKGNASVQGCVIDIDDATGQAKSIKRINIQG